MRAKSLQHRQSFKDLRRLVALPDLGPWLGDLILRRSLKITAITGGAALFSSLTRMLGHHGPNLQQAASMTLTVGLSLTGLGLSLKLSPIFVRKARGIAEASQINLLEDYKKFMAPQHLGQLWDRVCQYVCPSSPELVQKEIKAIDEAKRRCHALAEHWQHQGFENDMILQRRQSPQVCFKQPQTQEGFVLSALYHLKHPDPSSQRLGPYKTCLDLYANILDGAPFHTSDMKLQEEGEHDLQLQHLKRKVYRSLLPKIFNPIAIPLMSLREAWIRTPQKLWFPLCSRAISSRVGQSLSKLQQHYPEAPFDALHLLWPGREQQDWITELDGARELVLQLRKDIITSIFGPELEGAQRMLDRMLLPNAIVATELRYGFDPDYCHGRLDAQLTSDLITLQCEAAYEKHHQELCHRRAKRLDQICLFLEKHTPEFTTNEDDYLILRCCHHTRSLHIDRLLKKDQLSEQDLAFVKSQCHKVLTHKNAIMQQLLYIRTYQTLSIISIEDYRQHLTDLIKA